MLALFLHPAAWEFGKKLLQREVNENISLQLYNTHTHMHSVLHTSSLQSNVICNLLQAIFSVDCHRIKHSSYEIREFRICHDRPTMHWCTSTVSIYPCTGCTSTVSIYPCFVGHSQDLKLILLRMNVVY